MIDNKDIFRSVKKNDAIDIFRNKFPNIPEALIESLAEDGQLISLKKKAFFSQIGSIDQRIGLVMEGIFRGFFLKDGEEISSWFSSEYDIIASYMGILSQAPSKLSYQALEDSTIFVIDYNQIKNKSKDNIEILKLMIEILEKQLLESYQRIERNILQSPEERFKNLLEQKPEIFNRVSQRMLASYVGVTPVSLSRIKARLTPKRKY